MAEFINEIAKVEVPQSMIDRVDVKGLIKNLHHHHKRLDEFKNTREKHEKRTLSEKFLDVISLDTTLEDAQLEAVQVQSQSLKAIGQLLVLSIMFAHKLEDQQQQIILQQAEIEKQTTKIKKNTDSLHGQQKDLKLQNDAQEKLMKNFIALQSMTHENAKETLSIANDAKKRCKITSGEIKSLQARQDNDNEKVKQTLKEYAEKARTHEEILYSKGNELSELSSRLQNEREGSAALLNRLNDIERQFTEHKKQSYVKTRNLQILIGVALACSVGLIMFILYRIH